MAKHEGKATRVKFLVDHALLVVFIDWRVVLHYFHVDPVIRCCRYIIYEYVRDACESTTSRKPIQYGYSIININMVCITVVGSDGPSLCILV